jgi:acyl carrier protein
MSTFPTYQEFIESLSKLAGGGEIALDRGLFEQGNLDSIDVVEWLYGLEERYGLHLGDASLEVLGMQPVRDIYSTISAKFQETDLPRSGQKCEEQRR